MACNAKIHPAITKLYSCVNTVVCDYIGIFLSDYLLNNPSKAQSIAVLLYDYFLDVNAISRAYDYFSTPSIIINSLSSSKNLSENFEFLPQLKIVLAKLENSTVKFCYGCGIEDPHIWNLRILGSEIIPEVFTTDFDYFSEKVNIFWELGYFYATLRWFKKISYKLSSQIEQVLLSFIPKQDLSSEFMFWLGVLSSYCGYRDSFKDFFLTNSIDLKKQYHFIRYLDEKVSALANKLLSSYRQNNIDFNDLEPITIAS